MNYIKHTIWGLATAGMLALGGCADDYLDTVPTDQVSDVTMASSLDNLMMIMNGIHREMVSQESGYQCFGGEGGFMFCRDWQADDVCGLSAAWYNRFCTWSYNLSNESAYNYKFWQIYYQWILNANKLLETLELTDLDNLSDSEKDTWEQIKGEALCLRGWAHFNMVQQYALPYKAGQTNSQDGVPYRTSSVTGELARSSVEETYELINKDLDEACTLLADKDVADVNHYSEMVAWGLKARVALAKHDFANAATYAEKSIQLAEADGRALMTGSQLLCGFADITSDTQEAMYAAMTPDDQTVYFYSFYAYMSWNFNSSAIRSSVGCINKELYETISPTDTRLAWWDPTGEAETPASNYAKNKYQNRKFTARSSSNAVGDVAFMRLAEIYLIAAEAYARNGQDAKAQEIFTEFQITRDPDYVAKGNTGDALIEEIMNSRRVELWGEGFRFFDLKRIGEGMKRGSNFDVTVVGFLEKDADDPGWVYEIPKLELDNNSLCTRNH